MLTSTFVSTFGPLVQTSDAVGSSGGQLLIVAVLIGAVRNGTSILYAALGETIAERAGVINLGTEGSMLCGCLAAYAIGATTGNAWVGVLAAMAAGGALAGVHAGMVLWRGANQLATGLTCFFLALGVTSLFGARFVGREAPRLAVIEIPGLRDIPLFGEVLFRADPLTYLSYVLGPAVWYLLFRSRFGLLLRGSGERPEVLAAHGHTALRYQLAAVVAGGVLAGLGGAQLSIAYTNAWFENMVQGKGFIAVALVIFAAWSPLRAMGGAYLFGAALALGPALQVRDTGINQFALDAIPYVLTLLVLIVLARRQLQSAPEGLRQVLDHRAPA